MEEHEFEQYCEDVGYDFSEEDDMEAVVEGYIDDDDFDIVDEGIRAIALEDVVDEEEKTVIVRGPEPSDDERCKECDAEECQMAVVFEPATPLEELFREVGLINLRKQYCATARARVMHDFRWLAAPGDLMFCGERVIAMIFPPAKVELVPQTVIGNLAIREGSYVTVTGNGSHLYMGAIPATPDISCVCEIVTRKERRFFLVTRLSIASAEGPVRAWTPRGEFFNAGKTVSWNDRLTPGDNIVMIDGDMWYYPEDRTPVVQVESGTLVDRKGRRLEEGTWAVADGYYTFDMDRKTFDVVVRRPPASLETYCAWKKLKRLPAMMYGVKCQHDRFEIDPDDYDCQDRSKLIENPRLRSVAMMRKKDKYRERCKVKYLRDVSRNIYAFSVWEISNGRCWMDHEIACTFTIPCLEREFVLTLEGRHLTQNWRRVVVAPGNVRLLLRQLRCTGDVVVVKSEVSRARGYCNSAWIAAQMDKIEQVRRACWHNPSRIAESYLQMWLEYYAPPEPDEGDGSFLCA